MKRLAVINVVGLSQNLLGRYTPHILRFAEKGSFASFPPTFPALTCPAQSAYLTGKSVAEHGIVGNGWYDRERAEVQFWKQSNHFVKSPKVWELLRERNPQFTSSQLFWWYNMYASVNYSITPRPIYPADGGKILDVYSHPLGLRNEIVSDIGKFPFSRFWGPFSDIQSSQWIAQSSQWLEKKYQPSLNLIYLPHLDYCLQKFGPCGQSIPQELEAIDKIVGDLISFFSQRQVEVLLLSEYGICPVSRPIHLNRVFRKQGYLQIKEELGLEMLDVGACDVFSVADHQIAHIYLLHPTKEKKEQIKRFLLSLDGVKDVRDPQELWGKSIATERAGDLIAVADDNAWFTYYYWLDDKKAPDFARTIDIHRKPGYDPVELFSEGSFFKRMGKISHFLLKKNLGFRCLLKMIPLDASLVSGSHGSDLVSSDYYPLCISSQKNLSLSQSTEIFEIVCSLIDSQ